MSKNHLLTFILPTVFFASSAAAPFSCLPQKDLGVFKTFDRGENWEQKVMISKNKTLAQTSILKIALDPQDSKIVYLGTRGSGLLKSMDGGELWYSLADRQEVLSRQANVIDIAIDPRNSNNLYVGAYQDRYGVMLRSNDAGKHWEEVYRTARDRYAVFGVEIDPFDSSLIYMATAEGGLMKSFDFGKTWKTIKWFDDVITDLKINSKNSRIIYVSMMTRGVFKTRDQGQNWEKLEGLTGFSEAQNIETLVLDLKNPETIYTGSKSGFLKSVDGGLTWQKLNILIPPRSLIVQSIALDPTNSAIIYYAAGNAVYQSQDSGQSWKMYLINSASPINTLVVDPENSQILYAGMISDTAY